MLIFFTDFYFVLLDCIF